MSTLASLLSVLFAGLLCVSESFPAYPGRLPNGDASSRLDSGISCLYLGHEGCVPGAPRNQFGLDFARFGRAWTPELCRADSDGDGLTNGEELGDPCCVWKTTGPGPLRTTGLSHPGDASSKNDITGCRADAAPPSPTPVSPSASASISMMMASPSASTSMMTMSPSASMSVSASASMSMVGEDGNVEPSNTPPESDSAVCFPASGTVDLINGHRVPLSTLSIGDYVLVSLSPRIYSRVFLFTHRVSVGTFSFALLRTANATLRASAGHYVYANGGAVRAGDVRVGDILETVHGRQGVLETASVKEVGLYNPQTEHGDIVVDGVKATTYTEVVKTNAAHALLAPVRAAFRAFGVHTDVLDEGCDVVAPWVPSAWTGRSK